MGSYHIDVHVHIHCMYVHPQSSYQSYIVAIIVHLCAVNNFLISTPNSLDLTNYRLSR